MAAKGYCTYTDVEEHLGLTFTAAQIAQCTVLIEQAETYLDGETNRAWLTGAITDEAYYRPGHKVYLKYVPVTSISAITGRDDLGEAETALTVDVDYEVRDLAEGYIYLEEPGDYDRILVDYTPTATVPNDIKLATVELIAGWMQPSLNGGLYGVDSYSLPDLTVKFNRAFNQSATPPVVQTIINRYRFRVHG